MFNNAKEEKNLSILFRYTENVNCVWESIMILKVQKGDKYASFVLFHQGTSKSPIIGRIDSTPTLYWGSSNFNSWPRIFVIFFGPFGTVYIKLGHDRFLPNPLNPQFTNHLIIWRFILYFRPIHFRQIKKYGIFSDFNVFIILSFVYSWNRNTANMF
jgi:hypothetical protein